MIPALTKDFNEFANPHLKSLAEKYIPCEHSSFIILCNLKLIPTSVGIGVEQPQLEINVDELTPKVLRETLLQHIVASWGKCLTQFPQYQK